MLPPNDKFAKLLFAADTKLLVLDSLLGSARLLELAFEYVELERFETFEAFEWGSEIERLASAGGRTG